ncbi:MAG: helix-turn-helix domain-containing protein [Lachnospiraceae bacterium]|nr:helix-turn-helix domain-containing protein [Lachnospiraceae bacterium]
MDQKKTGQFIAELRKEKELTQKALADRLGITNKAVSKWECGNSLPDNSIMVELCDILEISVNELLAGERISSMDYTKKAEENMMSLIKEREENKKEQQKQNMTGFIGKLVLILYLIWLYIYTTNDMRITYFIDFAGLSIDAGIMLLLLMFAGKLRAFVNLFKLTVKKTEEEESRREAKDAASFAIKAVLLAGGINSVLYLVNWLRNMNDISTWGPNMAVIILGVFYSLLISALLLVLKERV